MMSDLNELKVTELKARLREAKLPTSGVKTTLVRRLMEHIQAQSVTQIVEEPPLDGKLEDLIKKIGLTGLKELFQREKITLDILSEMDHSAMKDLGILAYGDRHRLIKELKLHNQPQPVRICNSDNFRYSRRRERADRLPHSRRKSTAVDQ